MQMMGGRSGASQCRSWRAEAADLASRPAPSSPQLVTFHKIQVSPRDLESEALPEAPVI